MAVGDGLGLWVKSRLPVVVCSGVKFFVERPPLAVAVLDAGGNLVAFKRDDRAGILRFDIAFGKAWGALGMGFGSRTVFERANSNEAQRLFYATLAAASGGKIVTNPAGILIRDAAAR